MNIRAVGRLIAGTFDEWMNDNVPTLAASLAFYTIFSIAPVLMIIVGIAGILYDEDAARTTILTQVNELAGPRGSRVVETALRDANANSGAATVFGLIGIFFGATAVFANLQDAMNAIWGVAPKPGGRIWPFFRKRIFSFFMVVGFGLVLLLSLIVSTVVRAVLEFASAALPFPGSRLAIADATVWLIILTFCFALVYKVIPDAKISWPDVWVGAVAAAFLFVGGQLLISIYITRSSVASTFGAAGSLVVFLLWIYYSAQVFLLCGEFTQVYARYRSHKIVPAENAVRVTKVTRTAA
jgi:membrane protein